MKEIYEKMGRNGYLTIVYSNRQIGMQNLLMFEKWVKRMLALIGFLWIGIYAYGYYLSYS